MQRRTKVLAAALAAAALVTASAPVASARGGGSRFVAGGLKGANEVPPASTGDPDGAGYALVELDRSENKVCVLDAAFGGTGAPVLFHIHKGAAGVNGDVVVDFTANLPSGIGCGTIVSKDKHLVQKIRQHPEQYYLNMHTAEFMGGAIRGQLITVKP
jgi:hypothetical protein